jgi:hypothetical protein
MTLTLIEGGPDCMRDDCMITVQSQQKTTAYNNAATNVNSDRNKTIQEVRCLSCGKNWKKEYYGTKTNP